MGEPENPEKFMRLAAGDLTIYVAQDIWASLKPKQSQLLVAVSGYGRFWLHLESASATPAPPA